MRKYRYTEEQMVKILREADKSPVAEVAKKYGISEQTLYVWRKRYGKLETADVKQLRTLQQEQELSQVHFWQTFPYIASWREYAKGHLG